MRRITRLVPKGLGIGALVVTAVLLERRFALSTRLAPDRIEAWLAEAGPLTPLLFVLVMALAVVSPAPTFPLDVLAGRLFGALPGAFLAVTGATVGASARFLLARWLGRDFVARFAVGHVDFCRECSDKLLTKVVFLARLIPAVSFDVVSYGAGLTKMSLGGFAARFGPPLSARRGGGRGVTRGARTRTILVMAGWIAAVGLAGASLLGFDLERASVPPSAIVRGGPPRDGIPAIQKPVFVPAAQAAFLGDRDRVIGLEHAGEARAYPVRILNWHEVVNDRVGGLPVAVTWCPLTASAVVFDRRQDGGELVFGVSGLLYQSNVLVYDHQSESLWSQLAGRAIAGPRTGARLQSVPAVETTWREWRTAHPATQVLSTDTGYRRDYAVDPYADYHASPSFAFETSPADARLRVKDRVLGIVAGGEAIALEEDELRRLGKARIRVGEVPLRVRYDRTAGAARVTRTDTGAAVPATWVYWFAWSAIHPGVRLWRSGDVARRTRSPETFSGTVVVATEGVEVAEHAGYWTDLPGIDPSGDLGGLLVVRGTVRNRGATPLHHVRLVFELLDGEGRILFRRTGYNRGAETLTPLDAPADVPPDLVGDRAELLPIGAGGEDSFRMLVPSADAPGTAAYRVVVDEAVFTARDSASPTP
ncbi:MAG TPA: DUF3179 domain-containing (seleno)protein [Candidatus Limnocylindria bacterium]|nr:DUF3179 domain-containing (seleno)protein [Candidatus Limnocylindria bacterium]